MVVAPKFRGCTEAVFQSLSGVYNVEQGFVASTGSNTAFSEAVVVHFNSQEISLSSQIEVHLHTHKSTSTHSMRPKYRSAIYSFTKKQHTTAQEILQSLQPKFEKRLITQVLSFSQFEPSKKQYIDYYLKNPKKPFCENYITPKLEQLSERYPELVKP